jgi:two-component system, OmpR family, response regulator
MIKHEFAAKPKILIVDDDPHIRGVIRIALETAGMASAEAGHGHEAIATLRRRPETDLILLDVGMPIMDGFACCREIRSFSPIPVLFLTAKDDEIDRVVGFELGADDYVVKPFSPRELVLRIKAILARGLRANVLPLQQGDLKLDAARHTCSLGGRDMCVTVTEFAVIATLLAQPGIVLDRNALIDGVYGGNAALSGRTMDSHIRNIRAKAAALGYMNVIETVRGVGLRIGTCLRTQDIG